MKFWKILMTGCKDIGKKHQKCPKCFSPICDPPSFFQKSGSVTFAPLWCPYFMQKIEKTKGRSQGYLKTEQQTDRQTTYEQG